VSVLLTARGDQTAYDVLVALHVAAAVVGFGSVAMSGVYGGSARRADREEAMEELRRYFGPPGRLELLIAVVPFLGAAALAVGPGTSHFGQAWVAVGIALWLVAAGLLFGVVRPAEATLRRTIKAAPPVDGPGHGLRSAGVRLQWAAAASDLIFLVALVVMVIKPGS
jgi:hypothetical protein